MRSNRVDGTVPGEDSPKEPDKGTTHSTLGRSTDLFPPVQWSLVGHRSLHGTTWSPGRPNLTSVFSPLTIVSTIGFRGVSLLPTSTSVFFGRHPSCPVQRRPPRPSLPNSRSGPAVSVRPTSLGSGTSLDGSPRVSEGSDVLRAVHRVEGITGLKMALENERPSWTSPLNVKTSRYCLRPCP